MMSIADVPSILVFIVLSIVVCFRTLPPTVKRFIVGQCRSCKYDLKGLEEDAPCPECGIACPSIVEEKYPGTNVLDGPCLRQCVLLGVVFVVCWVMAESLQEAILSEVAQVLGLGVPAGAPRPARRGFDDPVLHVVIYFVACSPLALLFKPWKRLIGVAVILLAGFVFGTAQLAIG